MNDYKLGMMVDIMANNSLASLSTMHIPANKGEGKGKVR